MSQLGAKDNAEEDDAAGGTDVGEGSVSADDFKLLVCQRIDMDDSIIRVENHQCESKAADQQGHREAYHGNDVAPQCPKSAAHDAYLEDQGELHGQGCEEAESFTGDCDALCS